MAGKGHNRKGMSDAGKRLLSGIERIERLVEERKGLGSDISDIKKELKSAGFDVKVVNAILKIRKREPAERDEQNTLLQTYLRELGMDDEEDVDL